MLQDKYIISEFYSLTPDTKLIKEALESNTPIFLTGILQKANTLNRNGREYPFEILNREATKFQELVKEKRALGELDHPDSAVVSLSNVSHLVEKMWWEGETLMGRIQILETPSGNILKGLLKGGVMLGISSRGVGSVKTKHGSDIVQDDFELISFDMVSSPSTPGAYLFKEGRNWGMKKLTDDNFKTLKTEDAENLHGQEKYNKIMDISKNDFWKK